MTGVEPSNCAGHGMPCPYETIGYAIIGGDFVRLGESRLVRY